MTSLGFTGTRKGMTPEQQASVRAIVGGFSTVHHGDCIGADEEMHDIAIAFGQSVVVHPPADPKLRAWCRGDVVLPEKPYHDRNRDIVNAARYLLATPDSMKETTKGGTWYTVRYARQEGKDILIVWPDGTWTSEGPGWKVEPTEGAAG